MAGAYEALPVLYATLRVASAAPASQGVALVLLVLATARARGQKSRCATTLALPVCLAAAATAAAAGTATHDRFDALARAATAGSAAAAWANAGSAAERCAAALAAVVAVAAAERSLPAALLLVGAQALARRRLAATVASAAERRGELDLVAQILGAAAADGVSLAPARDGAAVLARYAPLGAAVALLAGGGGAPRPGLGRRVARVAGLYGFVVAAGLRRGVAFEPASYVAAFVARPGRVALLLYWAAALAAGVAAAAASTRPKVERRKIFHLLAVALFVPGAAVDAPCLSLAYGGALALLLVAEDLRLDTAPPFHAALGAFYAKFLDDRDGGAAAPGGGAARAPAALTHVYLLLGCALPHWLADALAADGAERRALRVGGVLVLGVGDAAAAVVGSRYGKRTWPGTRRTFLGSAAFFFATAAAAAADGAARRAPVAIPVSAIPVSAIAAVAALEAVAAQVDNLTLPLFYAALVLR